MAKEKYIDIPAIVQLIGGVYLNNSVLDNSHYFFDEDDFTERFHKILFGTIYNLHNLGVTKIDIIAIEDYLQQRPEAYGVYQSNKGREYIQKLEENTQVAAFDYYYGRVKKMTLFRMYEKAGINLSWLYDIDNILDTKKKQAQEDWLDSHSLEEIADIIDSRISQVRSKYVDNSIENAGQAGDDIFELIEDFKAKPEFGIPLYGKYINTITRGARLSKVYMRSAATGLGKTRTMIADACTFACDTIFDLTEYKWVSNGTKEPTVYITTEQDKKEIQSMMLAFVSAVDEEHILTGKYENDEYERVKYAAKILQDSPLYIEMLPDFSMQDIENCIKRNIQLKNVKYICYDYIHTSMKILSEISSKTGVKGLREDNILFMIGVRLKDIAMQYGVFIITSTQLNGGYVEAKVFDQNLLRGAKSLGDKIDVGMIMLRVEEEEKEALGPIIRKGGFEMPDIKISVYKNRRSRYEHILIWCKSNRGICRIDPLFVTGYNYDFIPIEDTQIKVVESSN